MNMDLNSFLKDRYLENYTASHPKNVILIRYRNSHPGSPQFWIAVERPVYSK